jgi:hypothetical protein
MRFDGQFGLLRNYKWTCVFNRVRKCERKYEREFYVLRRARELCYWLS